jgi:hypothetical protein
LIDLQCSSLATGVRYHANHRDKKAETKVANCSGRQREVEALHPTLGARFSEQRSALAYKRQFRREGKKNCDDHFSMGRSRGDVPRFPAVTGRICIDRKT